MCDLMRLPGDLNHCAIVYRIRIHTHAGGRIVCVAGWNGYRLRDDVFIQVRSAVVEIYMIGICSPGCTKASMRCGCVAVSMNVNT